MREAIRHIRITAVLACTVICTSCGDSYIPGMMDDSIPATEADGGITFDLEDTALEEDIEEIHIPVSYKQMTMPRKSIW